MQHVKKCSSDGDVVIQSRRRNLLRLRLNRKSQAMFRFPFVDRLYKQHSALESSVPHSADSFPGERCLHWVREPDCVTPGGLKLLRTDFRNPFDIFPNSAATRLYLNRVLDRSQIAA